MKTLIYGGAFNPPHLAHVGVIEELLAHSDTEKLVVLPSGTRLDKNFGISEQHRIGMIRAMVQELTLRHTHRIVYDPYFLDHPETPTTTKNEYAHTRATYGSAVSHVFGSDVLEAMTSWWDLDQVTGANSLYVAKVVPKTIIQRPGIPNVATKVLAIVEGSSQFISLQNPIEASSTDVRKATDEVSLRTLVPSSIADYILTHELYSFHTSHA